MLPHTAIFAFASIAAAAKPGLLYARQSFSGVATFNNYAAQSGTVCGSKTGSPGTYGAAAGDISANIAGGTCYANVDMSQCAGQSPVASYVGPACPKNNCGLCYSVTNNGGFDGASIGGQGNSVIVQIIDSCPSVSAYNYCKTDVPAEERCGSSSTNSLDIDQSAYQALTGQAFADGVPNLDISISPVACP